jgi:hypothetical protein
LADLARWIARGVVEMNENKYADDYYQGDCSAAPGSRRLWVYLISFFIAATIGGCLSSFLLLPVLVRALGAWK